MPFRSEAQRRYLWLKHPEIARRWAKKYGTPTHLPAHVALTREVAKKKMRRR